MFAFKLSQYSDERRAGFTMYSLLFVIAFMILLFMFVYLFVRSTDCLFVCLFVVCFFFCFTWHNPNTVNERHTSKVGVMEFQVQGLIP